MKTYFGSSKQVGTVILYGIPIVSLYIESQEASVPRSNLKYPSEAI